MDVVEHCLWLCKHIKTLTGVHCTLLNMLTREFEAPPYQNSCALELEACLASRTHLFGAYESQRWEGKYIYYCPRGLVFCAVTPQVSGQPMDHCMIVGPIVMTNSAEDPFDDPLNDPKSLQGIPRMTTAQVRSLSEMTAAALSPFPREEKQEPANSAAFMQLMYDYTVTEQQDAYPIENEHRLQEYISAGRKADAQKLLNELLAQLYASTGNDLDKIRPRIRELLVLMNRAAIDGGADADEIFSLCVRYENELDTLDSIENLNRWLGMILHQFIGYVFDFNAIKHQNIVFKATAYMKEHIAERLTLDQVAAQVFLSKSYFCRILKSELGCTFTEYVNHLRVERGKTLLRSTRKSVAEIALEVGFGDQSYFTRIFKRQTGCSPGRFRGG